VPNRATTTISPVGTPCFAMRKRLHGVKITVVSAMESRPNMVSGLAMRRAPSVDFCGCWQRHVREVRLSCKAAG
jgi:hypothetical protein